MSGRSRKISRREVGRHLQAGSLASSNVRRRSSLYVKIAIVSAVALLLAVKPYIHWKSGRFTALAGQSLAAGHPEQAVLEARVALDSDEENRLAINHLASAYEALNDPRLLGVLEKLAGEKGNLRYVRAALTLGELDLARESLSTFQPQADEEIEYYQLGTLLAERATDAAALFEYLKQLIRATDRRSEPGASALLKLAGLTALSADYTLPDEFLVELEKCGRSDDPRALDAAVLLWAIMSRSGEPDSEWLEHLLVKADDSADIVDKKSTALLRAMDFAIAFDDETWQEMLLSMQEWLVSRRAPQLAGNVLQWMQRHQQFAEISKCAIQFATSLSPQKDDEEGTVRIIVLARVLVADACARANDWQGVGRWCEGGSWEQHEFLRSLLLARALSGGSKEVIPVPAQRWLGLAIGQALGDQVKLQSLEKASRTYGPRGLWIELHRGLATRAADRDARLRSLAILKRDATETGNLMLFREATGKLGEMIPGNWADQHNALFAGALMDVVPVSTVPALFELQKTQPDSVDVKASLGLAQARIGQSAAAMKTIEAVSSADRKKPGIAPFCAIVYGLAGDQAKALEYANLPADLHFPEAHRLLLAARKSDR
ncbi:MAG: hypothetical protein ACI9R3_002666 [Verrucomicrobiales bacterium]|jgi:hypothetical protein